MKPTPKTSVRVFSNSLTKPLAVSVAALLMATPIVNAATYTWNTAATTGTWDNTASWASATVPTSADTAYFANTSVTSGTLANDAVLGLQFANTGALTLNSGTISIGASGINHTATGAVTIASAVLLAGSQTWTNVAGSALTVSGSVGASSAGSVVLTNTGAGSTTITGAIGNGAGTVSLLQSSGTLTLGGANTFSGGVTLNGGTLLVQGNSTPTSGVVTSGPLGTGTLTLNGGTFGFVNNATAYTIANNVNVTAATLIQASGAGTGKDDIFNGKWSGSGNLTLQAIGSTTILRFGGDNSGYTGTFTQNAGNTSLQFDSASAGSAGAAWVFNNTFSQRTRFNFTSGTISFGSLAGSGNLANVSGAAGIITLSVGALNTNTTFTGVIAGNTTKELALTKVGTGSLTLTGLNSYGTNGGITTVEDGSLIAGVNAAVSTAGAFGNSSTAIALGDATTISSATAMNPKLLIGGAFTVARNITVGANNNALGNSSTTFTMGGSTANNATFSGTTTLNQNLSVTQVTGGTLNLSGNITSGASGTQTVTLNNVGAVSVSGTIGGGTGTIALTKSNSGTATLTGNNTYTGATNINAGELDLAGTLAGSTVNVNAGVLGVTGTIGGGAVNVNSGTATLSGAGSVNGATGVNISGGTLFANSSVAVTPTVTVNSGILSGNGTVNSVVVANNVGSTVTNASGSTLSIGSLTFNGVGSIFANISGTTSNPFSVTSLVTSQAGTGEVVVSASNTNGTWANGAVYTLLSYGALTGGTSDFSLGTIYGKTQRQSMSLGSSGSAITMTVTGATPIWTGSTGSVWSTATVGGASNWKLDTDSSATDFLSGDVVTFDDTAVNKTVTINDNTVTPTSVTFKNNTSTYTLTGTSGIQTGSLTVSGSGTVILANPNVYSGATTINSGTLQIGNGGTTGSIANTSSIANNGALVFDRSDSVTQTSDVSGSGSLTQAGSGLLTVLGTKTYTGATYITGGTLQIGNGTQDGSIASTSGVLDNGSLVFDRTGNATVAYAISGTGSVTQSGTGLLTLTSSNTYTGATYINSGTLQIGNGTQDGSIASTSGVVDNGNLVFNRTIDATAAYGISGTGSVTKSGTSTLTLAGNSSYTGATTINAGTLRITGALASASVTTGSGAILQLEKANAVASSTLNLNNGSSLNLRGDADTTFANAGTAASGTVNINADQVIVAGGNGGHKLALAGTMNLATNATLNASAGSGDTLAIGPITIAANNGTETINAASGSITVASITSTGFFDNIQFTGAGNLQVLGSITNTATARYTAPTFAQSGTVTLWGANNLGQNSGANNPKAYFVNGVTVLNNNNAVFATSAPTLYLGNISGTNAATVLLGGSSTGVEGGITVAQAMTVRNGSTGAITLGGKNTSGLNTFSGSITLGSADNGGAGKDLNLVAATGGTTAFTGGLKQYAATTANVNVNDATHDGLVIMGGVNTYTGATTVNAGELDVNGSLVAASTVGVNSGAVLGGSGTVGGVVNLYGSTLKGNGLTVSGQINATGNSNVNGTVTANGGVSVSNGATLGGSGTITGAVGVTNASINGSGLTMSSATFDGSSHLTGTTTISAGVSANSGTLSIAGGNIAGAVTVNSGATLTGAGSVSGITLGAGATLSPATAADVTAMTMISNGDVSFNGETSTFAVRLGVSLATDSDRLSVIGGLVDLSDATLSLSLGSAFYEALANGQLAPDTQWLIIENSDLSSNSLVGNFIQGTEITGTGLGGDYKFLIHYGQSDNTSSNVYLELESVPEPSTWAMVVGGLGMLAFGRRFRRGMVA